MPKTDLALAGGEYAPVADRITLFYERFPEGRIITELVARDEREVTFRAAVYRSSSDRDPAATGWAAEREGDGDINTVACLENTETSAIGRALANLGFTASAQRPSAEEMGKASRARARLARRAAGEREPALKVSERVVGAYGVHSRASRTPAASDDDLLRADIRLLLESAERAGVTPARLASARQTLERRSATRAELERLERGIRAWLARRDAVQARGEPGGAGAAGIAGSMGGATRAVRQPGAEAGGAADARTTGARGPREATATTEGTVAGAVAAVAGRAEVTVPATDTKVAGATRRRDVDNPPGPAPGEFSMPGTHDPEDDVRGDALQG